MTLSHISLEDLHKAFIEVFSDYQVPLQLSYDDFYHTLLRKGFESKYSIGAFEGNRLVGFVLNGLRIWEGKRTLYDIGTGVIPSMRHQGITKQMLYQVKEMMKIQNIHCYLLEVLQTNQNALSLYQKEGFHIQKSYKCFRIQKEEYLDSLCHAVNHVDNLDLYSVKHFWNSEPSWQNSIDSIEAVNHQYYYSVVYNQKKIVGYGVIDKTTGDIGQLAVDEQYRHQRIGLSIVTDLIQRTSSSMIRVVNVEDTNTQKFFLALGFDNYIDQYAMMLNI